MEKKGELHPRNPHKGRYDLDRLIEAYPALREFVAPNKYGDMSINFFDSAAVKALNRAILALYYKIEYWDIPPHALTPPIPSRADYIHYLADLIGNSNQGTTRCLDIGVGANMIYPIIGCSHYGWHFVGSDISQESLSNAQQIIDRNDSLKGCIELKHQPSLSSIFEGVIAPGDYFDATLCNPPFHDSPQSAAKGTMRKLRNLKGEKSRKIDLNFGGQSNELWCNGGEKAFICRMIRESLKFKEQVGWFTTLVSKEDNLPTLRRELQEVSAKRVRVIDMSQGNKKSRVLAWSYNLKKC